MKINIEAYDEECVYSTAYILNHFNIDLEVGLFDDAIFIDVNATDKEINTYPRKEGLEINLGHFINEKDINKYGGVENAYMIYKNEMPMNLYILIGSHLYSYSLENIGLMIRIGVRYSMKKKYDVSNSDIYKKMILLGIPEDGLSDSKIKQMIEQGTEIKIE